VKNLWCDEEAKEFEGDLATRVYTSNLLGRDDSLVLHGGGNTSVKSKVDGEDILYVKGSGWDLVSIKEEGFAPVELTLLQDMVRLDTLSDSEMVAASKEAMIDKSAPNPSVEAILHAIIPFKYVDHTHADAVVTISNSQSGFQNIEKLYPNFLIIPYVMPGFILAQTVYKMAKDLDWDSCDGIILHNHGIFTFDDDAKKSYDKMIDAVSIAEEFLDSNAKLELDDISSVDFDIDELKHHISEGKGYDVEIKVNQSKLALNYSRLSKSELTRGVLTPEHIIRCKHHPLVLKNGENILQEIEAFVFKYRSYFDIFAHNGEVMLNSTPNYAVIEDFGVISFGKSEKEVTIIDDIVTHTMEAVLRADKLGGYQSISLKDSFDMEYWELEQAKLKK
jgi:rhamnose utilization protein RhaD (predicted bifunctional aldolase and dehydrogenase)